VSVGLLQRLDCTIFDRRYSIFFFPYDFHVWINTNSVSVCVTRIYGIKRIWLLLLLYDGSPPDGSSITQYIHCTHYTRAHSLCIFKTHVAPVVTLWDRNVRSSQYLHKLYQYARRKTRVNGNLSTKKITFSSLFSCTYVNYVGTSGEEIQNIPPAFVLRADAAAAFWAVFEGRSFCAARESTSTRIKNIYEE